MQKQKEIVLMYAQLKRMEKTLKNLAMKECARLCV